MANEAGEALFHIHNISKTYTMGDVEVNALRGVDFDLWAGEFVVILGRPKSWAASPRGKQSYCTLQTSWTTAYGSEMVTRR